MIPKVGDEYPAGSGITVTDVIRAPELNGEPYNDMYRIRRKTLIGMDELQVDFGYLRTAPSMDPNEAIRLATETSGTCLDGSGQRAFRADGCVRRAAGYLNRRDTPDYRFQAELQRIMPDHPFLSDGKFAALVGQFDLIDARWAKYIAWLESVGAPQSQIDQAMRDRDSGAQLASDPPEIMVPVGPARPDAGSELLGGPPRVPGTGALVPDTSAPPCKDCGADKLSRPVAAGTLPVLIAAPEPPRAVVAPLASSASPSASVTAAVAPSAARSAGEQVAIGVLVLLVVAAITSS